MKKLTFTLLVILCLFALPLATSASPAGYYTRRTPTPRPTVAPTQPPVYGLKGIALADSTHKEDIGTLGASWFYNWSWDTEPGAIPMVRAMQLPPSCAPVILVGNEPNAREPNGAPVTPADAVTKVKAIQAMCPQSLLVVGNVSADDWSGAGGWGSGYDWLRYFLADYPAYSGALGIHCYTQGAAAYCLSLAAQMRALYGGEMWFTEGNCLSCTTAEFTKLLAYASTHFTYYAFFTSRQPASAYTQGWALPGADLVNQDGTLTPNGAVYARWPQ